MHKKIIALLLALVFVFSGLPAFATDIVAVASDITDLPVAAPVDPGNLPARSAILVDQATGTVLYEYNADEKLPPASVTKIMTMLLVFEAIEDGSLSFDDTVVCSEHANSMGGTQIWLEPGEKMSVHDLLRAVATVSANDASVALGEHLAGSEEAFVRMMNERAAQLGMKNTNFVNATGFDAPGHLTTARDISAMSRELLSHPKVTEYTTIWLDSLRDGETQLVNTNKLVRFYKGATGLKTGTTNGAGHCLAASAERDGFGLVAVVMGSKTSDDRFASARGLLDYGFANFDSVALPDVTASLSSVKVLGGEEETVRARTKTAQNVVVNRADKDKIEQIPELAADLEAPVFEGQTIGYVTVKVGGKEYARYPLVAQNAVEELTFFNAIKKFLGNTVKMSD